MADSRSAVCSSRLILRCASGSRSRTRMPIRGGGPARQAFQYIHRNQHHRGTGQRLPRRGHRNTAVADGAARLRACATSRPSVVEGGKTAGHRLPRKIRAVPAQKLLDRARRENQPHFAIENENGVFQILQQVVDVAAQVGDLELRSPQPLAKQVDFGCHHREFVRGLLVGRQDFGYEFAAGEPVQHLPDVAQRAGTGPSRKETSAEPRPPPSRSQLPPFDRACPSARAGSARGR